MKNDNSRENRIGLYISVINHSAQGFFHHRLKEYKIGPGMQAYILAIIPGEIIVQDELAARLRVDKANVSRAVRGLENLGYIKRTRSETDKRSWNIALTEKGITIREKVETIAQNWMRSLKKSLTDSEWQNLEHYLEKIVDSQTDS